MSESSPLASGTDLAAHIERWAGRQPGAPAVAFEGAEHTYREFADQIGATARWLAEAGVREGDRVGWLGPNRPAALRLLFGCSWLGAIYLPLNSRLAPPEHRWILDHAEPCLLACDGAFEDHASQIGASCETHVLADEDAGALGPAARSGVPTRRGSPSHPVLLAYTSGTTGHPKGALLDQAAMVANAVNSTHAHDLTSADRILTPIPLFHVGGLNIQTLPTLLGGGAVLLHRVFDPGQFLDDVEQWQPSWTVLVPAALAAVAAHPRFDSADLGSLRGVMTGSSLVPAAVTRPFFDRGVAVGEIYGSTETAPIAIHLRCDEAAAHPGSCGKPSTMCEVRIVTDAGADAKPHEPGEVWVRGPSVARQYWRDPSATAEAITDGWFRTGDIGHADDDGWIFIDDRRKDMIISGGENIYPAELEAVLADFDLVAESTVVGAHDDRWGEVPIVVAVRLEPPTVQAHDDEAVAAALLRHFEGRLARFKHPRAVVWVDELPRTALGKVRKHEVLAMLSRTGAGTGAQTGDQSGDHAGRAR
ncbi:class I adenylate-forming enzyme family protein [Candidatus Poriferisodalis sp.]|uniref:class I adenylate-forming enzyme family protein n=1 Tax=Candidatus Poriferisodalis sp. TaxID=3101277 RepID=UPI003B01DE8D